MAVEKILEDDLVTITTTRAGNGYRHEVKGLIKTNPLYIVKDDVELLKRYNECYLNMKVSSNLKSLTTQIRIITTGNG